MEDWENHLSSLFQSVMQKPISDCPHLFFKGRRDEPGQIPVICKTMWLEVEQF